MNWPTPAPDGSCLKKQLGFLANIAFLRNGGRCDFHHKAIDLARMSGTIAHATHAAYAGLRIGRKIVGGDRSHRTRRRKPAHAIVHGNGHFLDEAEYSIAAAKASIIRCFFPSKCRNLGAKKGGGMRAPPEKGTAARRQPLGCEGIPPANYFSSYRGISVSSTSSRLPS